MNENARSIYQSKYDTNCILIFTYINWYLYINICCGTEHFTLCVEMWSTKCITFRIGLKLIVYLLYIDVQPMY